MKTIFIVQYCKVNEPDNWKNVQNPYYQNWSEAYLHKKFLKENADRLKFINVYRILEAKEIPNYDSTKHN